MFLGITFVYAGVQKLSDPGFLHPGAPTYIDTQLSAFAGLLTRAAAAVGLLLNLVLFLTNSWNTSPYFLGSDTVFVFAWLPFVLAGASGQRAIGNSLDRIAMARRCSPRAANTEARATRGRSPIEESSALTRRGVIARALGAVEGGPPPPAPLPPRKVLERGDAIYAIPS